MHSCSGIVGWHRERRLARTLRVRRLRPPRTVQGEGQCERAACINGVIIMVTSLGSITSLAMINAVWKSERWVWITPLGFAVVPEV